MKVRFWGARGSIPTPLSEAELREKIKFALQGAVGVDLTDQRRQLTLLGQRTRLAHRRADVVRWRTERLGRTAVRGDTVRSVDGVAELEAGVNNHLERMGFAWT